MRVKGSLNKKQKRCSVNNCEEKHYGKGFCLYHWRKQPRIVEREKRYNSKPETRERSYRRRMVGKYSLTPEKYDEIFISQQGRCKLCHKHQSDLTVRLCIEHDHVTGRVRGLTCHKCNIEIRVYEIYRNNPKKIKIMEEYLNALPISS